MKIAYIANARIPTEKAHGYQICKMCEEFARAGCEVELVIPTRAELIKQDLFSYYGVESNFTVSKVKLADFISWEKFLGRLSYPLQLMSFLIRLAFKKFVKETVIYSRQPEIIWLFSLKGYKTVLEAHKWPIGKVGLYKFLVKRVDKVIVLTQGLKKLFLDSGIQENRILVIPDAVDLEVFDIFLSKEQAREKLNLPPDKIILGYTGSYKTMGKDKGIGDILKSLKILLSEYPNIFFMAVGGSRRDIKYYQQIIDELKLSDRVSLVSRVDLDKLAVYQKAFDILLMPFPNIEHYALYMSPLKMFEYMASKRPIIATDLPAIREVLNENNALLVKPDNPENLAQGIKKILQSRQRVEDMVKQAYLDVKNYTWEKRVWKIIEFVKLNG